MIAHERVWMTRHDHDRLLRELAALRPRRSVEVPDDLMDCDANIRARYPATVGECREDEVATPGKVVTVRHEATGQTETFLLGRHGAGAADITVYSTLSPLGRAILGARPGERRFCSIPHGAELLVTVISVVPYGSRGDGLPGCAGRSELVHA
jgi:transcription elongation factor GreA